MTDEEIKAKTARAVRAAMYAMADAEAGTLDRMPSVERPEGVRAMVGMTLVLTEDWEIAIRGFGHAGEASRAMLEAFVKRFAYTWAHDLSYGGPCVCGKCGRP